MLLSLRVNEVQVEISFLTTVTYSSLMMNLMILEAPFVRAEDCRRRVDGVSQLWGRELTIAEPATM